MALKFAMILEAVDRFTRPGRRAQATQRDLTKGARDLARAGAPAARAMDRMSSAASRMRARLATSLASVKALAGRAGMKALEKSAYGAGYAIGWTIRKVGTLALGLAKLAGGAAIIGGGAFFGGVISTTAKFEQFQIMLEGIEGSAAKAKASMDWVRNFAKTTPYELDQVMEAFVQLKAYGIDPLDGALAAAGDAAAGMSKPLMQAIEALADAQTGEFERLKEFGIRARVEGDRVAFTYMKNGKEIRRETTKSAAEMKEAITGIWSERFGGMMERQSKTLNGMISNLKDGWSDFMLRVGQAGVFDKVKGKLQGVLDWLNAKLADGTIDRWATAVSDELGRVIDKISEMTDRDWAGFASDLKSVANGFLAIGKGAAWAAEKVAALVAWNDRAGASSRAGIYENAERGWFTSDAAKADARRKRRELEAEYGPMTETGRAEAAARRRAVPKIRSSPRASPLNLRGTPIKPGASVPQKVAVGGAMEIRIKADPGLIARPGNMASANPSVPLVYRGGAMTGRG